MAVPVFRRAGRVLAPVAAMAAGLGLLRRSFEAFAEQQVLLALGDPSGAELPELDLWLTLPPSLLLIVLGAFLAGRWWFR